VVYGVGVAFGSDLLRAIAVLAGLLVLLWMLNQVLFTPKLIEPFQRRFWPALLQRYRALLSRLLMGRRPRWVLAGMGALLLLTVGLLALLPPKVVFFPNPEPNFVYVYVTLPEGTDAAVTDSLMRVVEERVYGVLGPQNPLVTSVSVNVGVAAGEPTRPSFGVTPHKGRLTVAFVEYARRGGISTWSYFEAIRQAVADIPGAEVLVDKDRAGPPTGKAVNIEIAGDDLDTLQALAERVRSLLVDSLRIAGIERLVSDLRQSKPELLVGLDRRKAAREGLNSAQVGRALRAALYGVEASKFRAGEDDYPIQVRIARRIGSGWRSCSTCPSRTAIWQPGSSALCRSQRWRR
jgi:multidrug efflux pump